MVGAWHTVGALFFVLSIMTSRIASSFPTQMLSPNLLSKGLIWAAGKPIPRAHTSGKEVGKAQASLAVWPGLELLQALKTWPLSGNHMGWVALDVAPAL